MTVTDDLPPTLQALEVAHLIKLTVLDDMRLVIEPAEIARSGEHNSATFYIASQPDSLDGFVCRAEVQTTQGTTYRLVVDGQFSLTSDIAVQGINRLQLVYSDGVEIIRKTYQAPFHVSQSVNAVDESDPEFQDGLGQMQRAAFANAVGDSSGIQFYNVSDQPLDFVAWPPGQGGGIDEATADLLYLRRDGANTMTFDLRMLPAAGIDAPIRLIVGGRQAALRWENALILTRGQANEPVQIENNNGSNRSEIVTRLTGDALYLTPDGGDIRYLQRSGGQMTGPFISQLGSSNTNLGLSVGENSSGFWKSSLFLICSSGGAMVWQASVSEMMLGMRLNAATQQITNLGDPTANQDAVNRRTMDAAIAAIPRPVVPASRAFLPSEVTITTTAQEFFNQPFATNDNTARTIVVTVYPQFAEGTPSAFYDLEYTIGLSVGLIERSTVYPTANGYMGGGQAVCFAVTVTPVANQIPVQLSVRQVSNNPGALVQIGARANQRSYVVIQEMVN